MKDTENNNSHIPLDHPRFQSLTDRHKIIEGMKNLVVAEAGLIAHGRGECFDYILGEQTTSIAKRAIEAAVAMLLSAKHPIISVNGNVAALIPEGIVNLSNILNAPLEINLFYRKEGRIEAIKSALQQAGATKLLGLDEAKMVHIPELSSNRRNVDPEGIYKADVIFVPLEDGDRTEALKRLGKKVVTIDLNPISRTALWADITIVDNLIRAVPEMIQVAKKLKQELKEKLNNIIAHFDNKQNIRDSLDLIAKYIEHQKKDAFKILSEENSK
ncbi:MAG: phosphopantothenate/pantothenate synthetase [Promethearchaeota archaeon]|nr:MAG: phosphopantothenate/pantothenate synthetase [Candidatus Lokiarchaeota archaeon]